MLVLVWGQATYSIKEINYSGSYAKKLSEEKMEKSPAGRHNTTDWVLPDTIKAVIGVQFGIECELLYRKNERTNIQITWICPKGMAGQKGKAKDKITHSIPKMTNTPTYSNYTLEAENELVKGESVFIISKEGKELYRKNFILI